MKENNKKNLTLLGNQETTYKDQYDPTILETFENQHQENDYFVKFNIPEFTSLCHITGQPDFATIYLSYILDVIMVYSKSMKLYMFIFRNHPGLHEDVANVILNDLIVLKNFNYN